MLEGRRSFEAELARLQAVGDLQLAELGLSESTKNRVPVAGLGWATLNPWGADPHTEALRGMALMQDHLNQIRDYNITRRRAALENSISAIYQPFERIGSGDAAGSTAANRAQPAAAVPQCANFSTNSRQDPDLAVVPCPRAGWTCREYDCFQACRRSFDPLHPAVTACPLDAPVCISAGYCVPLGRVDYQLAIERIGERLLVDPGTWVKWPEEVPHHTRVWVDPGRRPTFHSVSSCLATRDLDDLSAHPGRTGSADHSLEHLECPTAAYPICYNGNNSRNGDLLHDRIFGVCSPIFPNIHHLQLNSFQQTAGPPAVVLTSLLATGAEAAVTSLGLDRFDAYEAGLCKVYQSVIGSLVGRAQIRSKPLVADLLSTLRGRDRQPKKKPKKKDRQHPVGRLAGWHWECVPFRATFYNANRWSITGSDTILEPILWRHGFKAMVTKPGSPEWQAYRRDTPYDWDVFFYRHIHGGAKFFDGLDLDKLSPRHLMHSCTGCLERYCSKGGMCADAITAGVNGLVSSLCRMMPEVQGLRHRFGPSLKEN